MYRYCHLSYVCSCYTVFKKRSAVKACVYIIVCFLYTTLTNLEIFGVQSNNLDTFVQFLAFFLFLCSSSVVCCNIQKLLKFLKLFLQLFYCPWRKKILSKNVWQWCNLVKQICVLLSALICIACLHINLFYYGWK